MEENPLKKRKEEGVKAPAPSNKPRWILLLSLLGLLLLLLLLGGLPRLEKWREAEALAEADPLPKVSVLQIEANTKPIELILPTSAQAWHITPISARVNGYLLNYFVDIGDVVKTGDLLAEIDTPETDQELSQAKADLVSAIAQRDIAKITSDRWDRLFKKNKEAVSKQEVDQYRANLESTEAMVIANQKNVERLDYEMKFKYIYAPFDGIITERDVDIGTLIYGSPTGTSQQIFQLAQTGLIRFFVDVPQNYYRQIKEGVEVEVTIQELPDRVFKGSVSRYAKALDPNARTLSTQINIENPEGLLLAGLFGKVKFLMKPLNVNFIIPTTAVIIRSGLPYVAVVDQEDRVHLKTVVIGTDFGKKMEITSGLEEKDRIVIIPSDQIVEGAKVEIIKNDELP